jgi:hypothetical protein
MMQMHEAFAAMLPTPHRWTLDQDDGTLRFIGPHVVEMPAQAIGSWVPDGSTLQFAHFNESIQPHLKTAIARLADEMRSQPGMGIFSREYLPCPKGFAGIVCVFAARRIGAKGLYSPTVGPTLHIAAM